MVRKTIIGLTLVFHSFIRSQTLHYLRRRSLLAPSHWVEDHLPNRTLKYVKCLIRDKIKLKGEKRIYLKGRPSKMPL